MAFEVRQADGALVVELTGWDRAINWRRSVKLEPDDVRGVSVVDRAAIESMIDHRARGFGTHNGSKRPGRRRVGTMLGRSVAGPQFWAVPAGLGTDRLVVLDLEGGSSGFARAVVAVDDPDALAKALRASWD